MQAGRGVKHEEPGYWFKVHKDRRSGDLVLRAKWDGHGKVTKWLVVGGSGSKQPVYPSAESVV